MIALLKTNQRKGVCICSHCVTVCDIGLIFDHIMCVNCGNTEYCDAAEQKAFMGNHYVEIDERNLVDSLKQVK